MKKSKTHCANCGTRLKAKDEGLMNCDGDPCCKACWDEEEYKLNQVSAAENFKNSCSKK